MNPRQIEAFRAVARVGAVTGAAESLNISQPAVSRLIANLEHELKIALFARRKGRLHLTPEGESFLSEVDRHFIGMDVLAGAARRIAEHGPEILRIVGFPSIAGGVLPKAIARHIAEHPGAQVSLDTDTTDRIAPQIASGRYDIGFATGAAPDGLQVDVQVIASRTWGCVLPPGHSLADRTSIKLRDLTAEPLVAFSPGMSLRQSVDRSFDVAQVRPDYRVAAQTIESICALTAEGCGAAVIHPYAGHIAQIYGLAYVTIEDAPALDLLAITPQDPGRMRIADMFINAVSDIA